MVLNNWTTARVVHQGSLTGSVPPFLQPSRLCRPYVRITGIRQPNLTVVVTSVRRKPETFTDNVTVKTLKTRWADFGDKKEQRGEISPSGREL